MASIGELLTKTVSWQHPQGMLGIPIQFGRVHLRRLVGAICLFAVAYVAAVHAAEATPAAKSFGNVLAAYASSDDASSDFEKVTLDKCHVCGAIACWSVQLGFADREKELSSPEGNLAAFMPKVIGPPPKAYWAAVFGSA